MDTGYYGSGASLSIAKNTGVNKSRSLVSFNVSTIPPGATVLNAQMKLYYYSGVGSTWGDRWVQAHQLYVSWSETQANRDNRRTGVPWKVQYGKIGGGSDSTTADANGTMESTMLFQTGQTNTWKTWDLSALTQKWVSNTVPNFGVMLWATNEDTDYNTLWFRSSEYSNSTYWPKLEVIYSTDAATKTVYFLKDHLGSIRATVLDSTGAPVLGYDDYDPWGYPLALRSKPIPNAYLQGASKNKFTGKERDEDFGLNLDYFGGRSYDWLIGRWPTIDPLWLEHPNVSPYVYVLNNPMILVDPDGQQVVYHRVVQKPPTPVEIKQNFAQSVEQSKFFLSTGQTQLALGRLTLGVLEAAGSVLQALDPFGISSFPNPILMAESAVARGATLVDDAILFGQKGVSTEFSKRGIFEGASLESVVGQLKSGALKADDVPVRFVVIDEQKVAADNRSLTVLSQAGLKPTKVIDVSSDKKVAGEVQKRLREMRGKPSKTIESTGLIYNVV